MAGHDPAIACGGIGRDARVEPGHDGSGMRGIQQRVHPIALLACVTTAPEIVVIPSGAASPVFGAIGRAWARAVPLLCFSRPVRGRPGVKRWRTTTATPRW